MPYHATEVRHCDGVSGEVWGLEEVRFSGTSPLRGSPGVHVVAVQGVGGWRWGGERHGAGHASGRGERRAPGTDSELSTRLAGAAPSPVKGGVLAEIGSIVRTGGAYRERREAAQSELHKACVNTCSPLPQTAPPQPLPLPAPLN